VKYGVLWRKTTKNIGDDIQSYAESLWYPQVDYMIDIENLDGFRAADDEPVACIMSAWYLWHKWNWPPSRSIYPLWIGFHYNDNLRGRASGMVSKWEYLTGPGYDYLQAYAPIGCRDTVTLKHMQRLGIDSYYSGCVTLTLPQRPRKTPARPYVCVVGVEKAVEKKIKRFYRDTDIEVKVIAPTRPAPSDNLSWEARKAQVEEMLDLYQNALAVYTFRLHCALPTLAMGTPVLMIRKNYNSDRLVPHVDYIHHCTSKAFLAGAYDAWMQNPPPNPETYLPVRRRLQKLISAFIEQTQRETRKADELVKTSYTNDALMCWQNETMKLTLHNYFMQEHQDLYEIITAKRELETKKAALADLQQQLAAYQKLGSVRQLKQELGAYRALGSVAETQTAVRRYRRLMRLPGMRLLKRIYRLFRKSS